MLFTTSYLTHSAEEKERMRERKGERGIERESSVGVQAAKVSVVLAEKKGGKAV